MWFPCKLALLKASYFHDGEKRSRRNTHNEDLRAGCVLCGDHFLIELYATVERTWQEILQYV